MRIIAISDIHSRFSLLEKLLETERADVLAVCGDVTDFSKRDAVRFAEVLERFKGISLVVHGNCDFEDSFQRIDGRNIRFIHGKSLELNGIGFHGTGGSTYTPFSTPSEYPESYYEKILGEFSYGSTNILISHCPPYGILDLTYSGKSAGSRAIRDVISRFRIILCGHVHERRGIENEKGTIVINPGPLSRGFYAIVDLENPEKAELLRLK